MPTELERQVAEAVDENGNLRWPLLSRECPGTSYPPYPNDIHHHKDICLCGGAGGRLPDASLRKLVDCFFDINLQPRFCKMDDGSVRIDLYNSQGEPVTNGRRYQPTPEEAACAALLASVQ